MFGFSREEMRTLGGGEAEQRPQSMTAPSPNVVSPASQPSPPPPSNFASELEGTSHATILEWQQAQAMMTSPNSEAQHQTTGASTAIPSIHPDTDPTQAPMVYPEPGQVPTRPTSTAPPAALSQHGQSSMPMPTLAQSQWLSQQAPPSNTDDAQQNAHSPSLSYASAHEHQQPAAQVPSPTPTPGLVYSRPQSVAISPLGHQAAPGVDAHQPYHTAQATIPPGHAHGNGQAVHQHPQGIPSPHAQHPSVPGQHPTAHASGIPHPGGVAHHTGAHGHLGSASASLHQYPPPNSTSPHQVAPPTHAPHPSVTPAHGAPYHQTVSPQPAHQHPSHAQSHANQAQVQHTLHQPASVQHSTHPAAHPPANPSKTKWKPSKKPAPNHRPSISSMSVASSVSSLSTDTGLAAQSISPPTYYQVVQHQQPQLQVQMQTQPVLQQPQQYISTTVGQTVSYPWKCTNCGVGLSPKNVYYECLICSTADLTSKLCQTCYLHGANSNSLALGHDVTYYICNQDGVVTNDTSIPPQKWTVKQNQFGRRWYQSCAQPVKTHIRPMTAAIPNHSGWIEAKTKQGHEMKVFWVNAVTGETSWQRPPSGMPKGWREVRTPEGKPFYVHDALELATWVYPGHQPAQTPQQTPTEHVSPPPAQISRPTTTQPPTSPPVIHAPQPVRMPVNGSVTVQSPAPQVNLQGQVQVNMGGPTPQPASQPVSPMPVPRQQVPQPVVVQAPILQQLTLEQQHQLKQQQKAAKKELKSASRQLGVAAAGGAMTAGLRMLGVSSQQASAMANGVIKVGKAGVNARKASKPQSPSEGPVRPVLQGTYSSSNGSSSGQVLLTPQQSPPGASIGIQQQMQGQYFVDAQGRPVQYQPVQSPPPTQVTNVQNIQQVQQVQDLSQQQGSPSLDVNLGGLQISDPNQAIAAGTNGNVVVDNSNNTTVVDNSNTATFDPTVVAQDSTSNTYVVDNSFVSQSDVVVASPDSLYTSPQDTSFVATDTSATAVTIDSSTYVDVTTQSQFMTADTTGFASTATGPVPTDLSGYYSSVDVTDQTSVAFSSVDANYAYNAMAQQGQEAALGLIDGTTYEEVTVEEEVDLC